MQVTTKYDTETEVTVTVSAGTKELTPLKEHVLEKLRPNVKLAGFRAGKAPLNLVERNVDQSTLQSEFIDEAVNHLYSDAISNEKLHPVARPAVRLLKFVPFTDIEFEAKVAVVSKVTLPDYKKIKKTKPAVKAVTAKDLDGVLESLQNRMGEHKDVDRGAKEGDQVWIDFEGVDAKGAKVNGASGKDYPIIIGSNTFIPGFEPNLVGLKGGQDKTFTVTFPKDYQLKAIAGKKVTFSVQAIKVQEIVKPKIDDDFAAKVGPFKTAAELKADVKKQLATERQHEADREFESVVLKEIASKSKLSVPDVLIDEEAEKNLNELKQNLTYRGQTFNEFLESEKKTEEAYIKDVVRPEALERLKASIVLSEIAEREDIQITQEELDAQMAELRSRYTDAQTLEDLSKPDAVRNVASRLVADKTIQKVIDYITK